MARAVIAGAGIAGLGAALLLARQGHEVDVVERDADPAPADPAEAWSSWRRPGVPQLRQFHGYTAIGRDVLAQRLPDVHAELLAAGAEENDALDELRRAFPHLDAGAAPLMMLKGRRTTVEAVLQRSAKASSAIRWHHAAVRGLLIERGRVTGVRTDHDLLEADVVVDATGRRARSSDWLRDAGIDGGEPERHPTGIVYFTRWYRAVPGEAPPRGYVRQDLDSLRAVLTSADHGFQSLALMAAADDEPLRRLRDVDAFQRLVERLPVIGSAVSRAAATPESAVLFMGGLENTAWWPVTPTGTEVAGLVPVGDSAICTNPYFGRGVALALAQAAMLGDALEDDPADAGARCRAAVDARIRPWFGEAVVHDRARSAWLKDARREPLDDDDRALLGDDDVRVLRALPTLMARDPRAVLLFLRYVHGVGSPRDLVADPALRNTALALDSLDAPALSRAEILDALAG